jgi:hypothetical protein
MYLYKGYTDEEAVSDLAIASQEAHRRVTESDVQQITEYLDEVLGRKLVATLAGVKDQKAVARWASGERSPRTGAEERLRAAYQIFRLLNAEAPHTVRAWFIGLNPQLDDESPIIVIQEGRLREAMVAARAYLAGG